MLLKHTPQDVQNICDFVETVFLIFLVLNENFETEVTRNPVLALLPYIPCMLGPGIYTLSSELANQQNQKKALYDLF
eukprot:snap_masked-scaffold_21-processed-gene-5.70-mRNA-1 protein AED:1.00 eAED:1.00 QI:0/0/0/0/1/1/3/0/76